MWYLLLFVGVVMAVGGLVLIYQPKSKLFNKLLLSFSGSYLFALIFLHLMPHLYEEESNVIGLYILFGFLLQLGLDYISRGIEHGHVHVHGKSFPLAIFIGLSLHSFFEGMPVMHFGHGHTEANYTLIMGIMIHKIPIVILLAGLLKNAMSKGKALIFIFLFAITLPLGNLLSNWIGSQLTDTVHFEHIVLSIVIGIMLHVSTTILYESDEAHKFNIKKVLSILLGFLVAYFTA